MNIEHPEKPRARQSESKVTAASASRPPQALSHTNVLSPTRKGELLALARAHGVREFPFGFSHAVSIVSDLDGSFRAPYEGYVGMLVRDLGLDFGDSTWLSWAWYTDPEDETHHGGGFGFFSPEMAMELRAGKMDYHRTRTFAENVREFHLGNVDHFHSFVNSGPRFVVTDQFTIDEGRVVMRPESVELSGRWRCTGQCVFGVGVIARAGTDARIAQVTVTSRDGTRTAAFEEIPLTPHVSVFGVRRSTDATDEEGVPRLDTLKQVSIALHGAGAGNVERVFLLNLHGKIVLDRLRLLRDDYNIESSLVTDHCSYHFRSTADAASWDNRQREWLATHTGPLPALEGAFRGESGWLLSAEADEPRSLCRVLPELSDELEVRFINPAGATARGKAGWSLLDVIVETQTRMGTGIYLAHRTLPNMQDPLPGSVSDGTFPSQESVAVRIDRMIDMMAENRGLVWPIYTHIGSFDVDPENYVEPIIPVPYFDAGPMHRLQNRVYNITGTVAPDDRIWFARGSTLYDYAVSFRGILDHIERPDANTVRIASWRDPVLDKVLPRSPAQLYGMTFYVEDAARGVVMLDGQALTALVRNGPDTAGRPSVTVAECEIQTILFNRLDPAANSSPKRVPQGGEWQWHPTSETIPAHGRLSTRGGIAILALDQFGLAAEGAQLLSLRLRIDEGAHFGFLASTLDGGEFYFGDRDLLDRLEREPTACYCFDHHARLPGQWQTMIAPFHDLEWRPGSLPGGPLPNHGIDRLTLICAGPEGSGFDVTEVRLLRPRATALPTDRGYCVVGSVPQSEADQTVHLKPLWRNGAATRTVQCDQRGHFCFHTIPSGLYRLWTGADGAVSYDRRGPVIEVGPDVCHLVLDRKGPS